MPPIHLPPHPIQIPINSTTALSPKSPNQQPVNLLPIIQPTAPTINNQIAPIITSTNSSNMMSTSLNSAQLQSHISGGVGVANPINNGGSSNLLGTSQTPLIMSTSLHGGNFDTANTTAWSSSSSLSPTIPASQRKCEVKLNAMP